MSDDKPKTPKREAVVFVQIDEPDRFADSVAEFVIVEINEHRRAQGKPPIPKG